MRFSAEQRVRVFTHSFTPARTSVVPRRKKPSKADCAVKPRYFFGAARRLGLSPTTGLTLWFPCTDLEGNPRFPE